MDQELFGRFRKCAVDVLSVPEDKVVPEARFAEDLEADSLDLVELVMGLEERFDIEVPEEDLEGVTTVVQNSDPFTYFRDHEVRVCENVALDSRTLSLAVLRRATQRDIPFIVGRVLGSKSSAGDHSQIDHFDDLTEARIESRSRDAEGALRPFPVQVDGDYIGEHDALELGLDPGALTVIA